MKKTTAAAPSVAALAAIPLFAAAVVVTADTSSAAETNNNVNDNIHHRSLSRRHWATLIPPSRVAALTLDDAHIHTPPVSSTDIDNVNYASPSSDSSSSSSSQQQPIIAISKNPNPTSPQSLSSQLEMAHDDAVSKALKAGASISQIENLAYGGGVVTTGAILDASQPGTNRAHANPAMEYSPHIFDMEPSHTQPWIESDELGKFVGGVENLRPDITEWLDIVLPEFEEEGEGDSDDEKITLDEILFGKVVAPSANIDTRPATTSTANTNTATTTVPPNNNQGAAAATTGGYTIDPVTGVYLDSNGMVITDPAAFGITTPTVNQDPTQNYSDLLNPPATAPTTPAVTPGIGSLTFPSPTTTTTAPPPTVTAPPPSVSTATILANIKEGATPTKPTNYPDPTIQGGVQLHHANILPYPLSLPWYPKDGKPWVDPIDMPAISGKSPVLDAINAAPSSDVKQFIRNEYWDIGHWSDDNFFSYGPPCSVDEVVAYNEQMMAQGRLDATGGPQTTGRVGKNGKINNGPFIPGLRVMGDDMGRGALGRCEGDCDEDKDCGPGLVCHQRKERELVPGCTGWGRDNESKIGSQAGTDYCVREVDEAAYDNDFYDGFDENTKMEVIDQETNFLLPPHCSGPQGWADLPSSNSPESKYWEQFSQWIGPSLHKNQCGVAAHYNHNPTSNDFAGITGAIAGVVGREIDDEDDDRDEVALEDTFETRVVEHQQSPIDVRRSLADAQCFEYHQIRHKKGDFDIRNGMVKKQILPNKLRLEYPQVYNENKYADGIGGPSADMPKGWGHQLPVTHVELKMPSEHWLEGRQYAAEYQIYLIQDRDSQRGAPAISVLVDLHPNDYPNIRFQEMLNQFQAVWDSDMADCESLVRRRRRILASLAVEDEDVLDLLDRDGRDWADVLGEEDAKFEDHRSNLHRKAQDDDDVWDPWHEDIITSHYFLGYEGSLTEPPCTEFLSWRVIDRPALISKTQLAQMKKLLFGHVDGKCRPTSNHYKGSVARPLQPFNDREMWQCTCRDYIGDDERDWYGRNRCWAGDEEIFHERTEDGLYWASKPPQPERMGVFDCEGVPGLTPPCCGKTYDPFHSCCARGDC